MKKKKLYVLAGMLLTISLVCMACGSTQETAALPDDANERMIKMRICRMIRTMALAGI